MSQPQPASNARIHDQGYQPFDGRLASVHTRFVAIAINELRQAWKSKWTKRLFLFSFFPLAAFAVLSLVQAQAGKFLGSLQIWSDFWALQMFFSMLAVYATGRKAVGEDLRTGALTVYFSRAVDFRQYLLGKWLAIAMAVSLVTLGPGLVLALFRALAEPQISASVALTWLAALIGLTVPLCLQFGWVMLGISSLTRRGRAAGVVWVLLYFLSSAIGLGLAEVTGIDALSLLGFTDASAHLARALFGYAPIELDTLWAVCAQLGWGAVGAAVVVFRLRRWRSQ